MVEFLKYKRQLEEEEENDSDYGVEVAIVFGVLAVIVIVGTIIANIYLSGHSFTRKSKSISKSELYVIRESVK